MWSRSMCGTSRKSPAWASSPCKHLLGNKIETRSVGECPEVTVSRDRGMHSLGAHQPAAEDHRLLAGGRLMDRQRSDLVTDSERFIHRCQQFRYFLQVGLGQGHD